MQRLLALFSGLTLVIFSNLVTAAEPEWLLAKYDSNGDEVISLSEVEDKRRRVFGRMDSNHDGGVSFAEYEQMDSDNRVPILKARFTKLDIDQDGILSGAEYASYLGSFERMDRNQDGKLTTNEVQDKPVVAGRKKPQADVCLLWFCLRKDGI